VLERQKEHQIAFSNLNTMPEFENHPMFRFTEVDSESGPVKIIGRLSFLTAKRLLGRYRPWVNMMEK